MYVCFNLCIYVMRALYHGRKLHTQANMTQKKMASRWWDMHGQSSPESVSISGVAGRQREKLMGGRGSGLQSHAVYFPHPSPIGSRINIHLKTSAGLPLPIGSCPNSVPHHESSFAACFLTPPCYPILINFICLHSNRNKQGGRES